METGAVTSQSARKVLADNWQEAIQYAKASSDPAVVEYWRGRAEAFALALELESSVWASHVLELMAWKSECQASQNALSQLRALIPAAMFDDPRR
jgi:hypothetical protein